MSGEGYVGVGAGGGREFVVGDTEDENRCAAELFLQ